MCSYIAGGNRWLWLAHCCLPGSGRPAQLCPVTLKLFLLWRLMVGWRTLATPPQHFYKAAPPPKELKCKEAEWWGSLVFNFVCFQFCCRMEEPPKIQQRQDQDASWRPVSLFLPDSSRFEVGVWASISHFSLLHVAPVSELKARAASSAPTKENWPSCHPSKRLWRRNSS